MTVAKGPLDGVRVLELGQFVAVPYAGLVLADLGAEVIKVEDPDHPDEARKTGPYYQGDESLYFLSLNWGKRSVGIRINRPRGRAALLDMVASADVVIDNFRPGVMTKLGLDHETLAAMNPRLVTCSVSAFGETGSYAPLRGYDYTIQALSGVMSLTGEPDGPPGKAGMSYVDHSGGLAACLAICAALLEREHIGRGRHIDLGLMDTQTSLLSYLAGWHLNAGMPLGRTANGAHQSMVPAQNFRTSDGWISLFVGNDSAWVRLTGLLDDERFLEAGYATSAGRREHRDELLALLTTTFESRSTKDWVDDLISRGVPCAPVNSIGEALASAPVRDRALTATATHPTYGSYQHVAGPIPTLGVAGAVGAPVLGQDTESVLRSIGYDDAVITELVDEGTLVASYT